MTIDIETAVGWDNNGAIILSNTGIKYTAQVDGVRCDHPEVEGFTICLGSCFDDFNSCKFGCQYISSEEALQRSLALGFDKYCNREFKGLKFSFKFDYSRLDQSKEGWIPAILNGFIDDTEFKNAKCIVYNGNCD
jgi:hypothetical protein